MSLPPAVLKELDTIEPGATFSGSGPRVTSSSGAVYYVKHGKQSKAEQWKGEVESLKAMDLAASGICPKVLGFGSDEGLVYMISNHMDLGSLSTASATVLARRLALELHDPAKSTAEAQDRFGFGISTYCGITRLENGWYESWEEAYGNMISQLLDYLSNKGASYTDTIKLGREVINEAIPHLLGSSRLRGVQPVILHGDLWSGNVGALPSEDPIIYDPASYYGHNEADLSIARIFGGFPSSFYSEYHKHRPKSEPVDEYDERAALYEIFHYLNHALIFGTLYLSPSISRMNRVLKFVRAKN